MRLIARITGNRKALLLVASVLLGTVLLSIGFGSGRTDGGTEGEEGEIVNTVARADMTGVGFRVIGSVVLIIGILYGAVYAMRKLSPQLRLGEIKQDAISVLHKRHIAPKKAIYILKVGSRTMVIGVTDSQISHLADLTDEEYQKIKSEKGSKADSFRQHLFGFGSGAKAGN